MNSALANATEPDASAASPPRAASIVVAAASNDEQVLRRDLLASPDLESDAVIVQRRYGSASRAYNAVLDGLPRDAAAVVFAHQDVYLPAGWIDRLRSAIDRLEWDRRTGGACDWAVIGCVGSTGDVGDGYPGRAWSSGLGRLVGRAILMPIDVITIDEMLIVVNPRSGVRFDNALPGYHLYGTDVVLTALDAGYRAVVADLPVIHNSRPVTKLDGSYGRAYRYMQKKWKSRLPIATCVVPVTRLGWPLIRHRLRRWRQWVRPRPSSGHAVGDPARLARELGFE